MTDFNSTIDAITKGFLSGKYTAEDAAKRYAEATEAKKKEDAAKAAEMLKRKQEKAEKETKFMRAAKLLANSLVDFLSLVCEMNAGVSIPTEMKIELVNEMFEMLMEMKDIKVFSKIFPSSQTVDIKDILKTMEDLSKLETLCEQKKKEQEKKVKMKNDTVESILTDFLKGL